MTTDLQALEITSPLGSLDAYINWTARVPILTLEEEQDLARRWYESQDVDAAKRLVMSHLRFVVKIARGYSGYGLSQADLIQEGSIGLMKAVKRFDPNVGVRLVSFAVHWIKAEMHEFIIRNWRIVKIATTKAQRKAFFNLRQAKKRLGWFSKKEIEDVANTLGIKPTVLQQMEARMSSYDVTFDAPDASDENTSATVAPANYLEDLRFAPAQNVEQTDWDNQGQRQLTLALSRLDDRSQDILKKRWLAEKKTTLQDLAATYNVSAERIRQLEQNALKKLKSFIIAS